MDSLNDQAGRRMDDIPGHARAQATEKTMDLAALCNLLDSLTDEQRHLETTALLTDDPSRQAEFERRGRTVSTIVSDIRGEVLSRELPGARSTGTAQEFETHLHRILEAYACMALTCGDASNGDMDVRREKARRPDAMRKACQARLPGRTQYG